MRIPAAKVLILPARIDNLYDCIDFVASCAAGLEFDQQRIDEIRLAVEEVLVNIINYAYPENPEPGEIEIACSVSGDNALIIEIADSGVPFNILSVKDPETDAEIDDRQIGGLGIYFVKQIMDDVRYAREGGRNRLTLTAGRTRRDIPA
jgi:anti-sigma regulatory factor (Ser/Thr protein kinase)